MRSPTSAVFGLAMFALAGCAPLPAQQTAPAPRLVVLVAVDQLRPDYFDRYGGMWTGGLGRFLREGAFFARGEQDHGLTETAPGHATMLSGRSPASTGIVLNSAGVGDPGSPLLGGATEAGASPHRFRGTTLYDWMLAADPEARALSVSMKDRGAILPVGRARASVWWYSQGLFTTSSYYARELPAWVEAFNARGGPYAFAGRAWFPLLADSQYASPDDQPWERNGRANVFPHVLPLDSTAVASMIRATPWIDSLTLSFALEGVRQERIGAREGTDLLVVSLSGTDVIGHAFGPDSREIQDHLLRLDRWLGQFLDSLAVTVPRDRTVLALTADHGVVSFPEASHARGEPGGRVSLGEVALNAARALYARYRTDFQFGFENGLLYADVPALKARGVDVDSLAAAMAREARQLEGVQKVYTPATLPASPDPEAARWRKAIPPDQGWLLAASPDRGWIWITTLGVAMHGTTQPEDVLVPIAFMGPGIAARRYDRTISVVDLGTTLAALVGVRPTEPVEGTVLPEVAAKP